MDIKKTIKALELYSNSSPHTNKPRMLLKLATIGGKTELKCIPEEELTVKDKLAGSCSLAKITAFLNSDDFCASIPSVKIKKKDIAVLKNATKQIEAGIEKHNKKPEFFSSKIKEPLNTISNFLTHLEATYSEKLSVVEERIIAKFNPELSPKEAHTIQAKAILKLDKSQRDDIAAINKVKKQALLEACCKKEIQWNNTLATLDVTAEELAKNIPQPDQEVKLHPDQQIPNLAKRKIQKQLHEMVNNGLVQMVDEEIDILIEATTISEVQCKKNMDNLRNRIKTYVEMCEKTVKPRYDFYEKWGSHLKAEMIHGFVDPNEALGMGACWALSLRWSIAELEKQTGTDIITMIDKMQIGTITPRDRFNQAFIKVTPHGVDSPELSVIKKKHNIKETISTKVGDNIKKEDLKNRLKSHLRSQKFAKHQGVGQLSFWWNDKAHSISISCQPNLVNPQKSVFRFGDPNIGVFDFAVPPKSKGIEATFNEYLDCLSDLLTTFHNTYFKEMICDSFIQN